MYLPAYAIATWFAWDFTGAKNVADLVAVAVVVAGVLVVARYRAALEASESARKAAMDEREIAVAAKERMHGELITEQALTKTLQARPDLTKLERLLERMVELQAVAEQNAAARSEQLVELISSR